MRSRREQDLGWGRREFCCSIWDPNDGEGERIRGAGVEILEHIEGFKCKRMARPGDRLSVSYYRLRL